MSSNDTNNGKSVGEGDPGTFRAQDANPLDQRLHLDVLQACFPSPLGALHQHLPRQVLDEFRLLYSDFKSLLIDFFSQVFLRFNFLT